MDRFQLDRVLEQHVTRRNFLIATGAFGGLLVSGPLSTGVALAQQDRRDLFTLGVASGDPLPDGVVLWTRLAPFPLNGGGMPRINVPVHWRIATDERMLNVVQQGTEFAISDLGHSVHVEVSGLEPARWYWYQFRVGRQLSPVGRTRTAPAHGASPDQLRFAFASCQDWQNGYYPAYKRMAEEDLDLVVHLGDYIYEYPADPDGPRQHDGVETGSLESYRNRHALYKTDRDLQAAHAAFPWVVVWDDHEVENDYADAVPSDESSSAAFLFRRANAYQAYYENQPLRRSSLPQGADMQLYRRLRFGDLAEFSVLDTRQYRTDQPCNDVVGPRCAEALDPRQTMTGPEQERWLLNGLERSNARWNVIAQQTMLAEYDFLNGPNELFNLDQWDGYVAARNRLLGFLLQRRPSNPIVITGDIHSSWVHDLKANFADPASETLGTEFVGPSISSDFPPILNGPVRAALADNPHTKFFDGIFHGYVRCSLSRDEWRSDFRVVSSILTPNAPIFTLASFVVEDGQPGAQPA